MSSSVRRAPSVLEPSGDSDKPKSAQRQTRPPSAANSLKSILEGIHSAVSSARDAENMITNEIGRGLLKQLVDRSQLHDEQTRTALTKIILDDGIVPCLNSISSYLLALPNGVEAILDNEIAAEWSANVALVTCAWLDRMNKPFAQALLASKANVISWMTKVVLSDKIKAKLLPENAVGDGGSLIECCLDAFYNLSRMSEFRADLLEHGVLDAAKPYLTSKTANARLVAVMITSNLVGDGESGRLADRYDVIPELLNDLKARVNAEDAAGWHLDELLECVTILAVNDTNRLKLIDSGLLPILESLYGAQWTGELQITSILNCIMTLAFGESARVAILANKNLMTELDDSVNDDDLTVETQRKAERVAEFVRSGGLGCLGQEKSIKKSDEIKAKPKQAPKKQEKEAAKSAEEKVVPAAPELPTGRYLFISYAWTYQTTVERIRDELKKRNYAVWIDVERMHGSTLDAMSSAIENAAGILMCYSEAYRKSPNCRLEAEYAFQRKKKLVPVNMERNYQPEGWLGMLIGSRLYVDMSLQKYPFEQKFEELIGQISMVIFGEAPKDSAVQPIPVQSPALPPPTTSLTLPAVKSMAVSRSVEKLRASSVFKWQEADVAKWLKEKGISNEKEFSGFTGRHLCAIYEMKLKAPDPFYRSALKFFNNSLPTTLRFSDAIECLANIE